MSRVWFTADTHFGHAKVIRHCGRPFATADEMDEVMLRRWVERVNPEDVVYHLGDFAFPRRADSIAARLPGRKYLLRGNHDRGRPPSGFEDLGHYRELRLPGVRPLVLCHYAFATWRGSNRGSLHLHGHSHGRLEPGRKLRLDVGVDAWDFAPVRLERVLEVLLERERVNRAREGAYVVP